MALIIEDGSNVSGANSYQTAADLRSFASPRQISVPKMDEDCEAILLKAMDALTEFAERWQGCQTYSDQALLWPRSDVYVDGLIVDSDSIPFELKYAQLLLAIEAQDSELQPNRVGSVTKEKVGPIEKVYSNSGTPQGVTTFSRPMALISQLLKKNGCRLVRT